MTNREINQEKQADRKQSLINDMIKRALVSMFVGIFIGLLAPFGMHQVSEWLSIFFWVTACLSGYLIYAPTIYWFDHQLQRFIQRRWYRAAAGAIFASLLMSFVIPVLIWLFFNQELMFFEQFLSIFPKALLIGGVITLISFMRGRLEQQSRSLAETEQALEVVKTAQQQINERPAEAFIQALPVEKRGKLLCLEMSDHYVKVYTDKGHHMLLMRFKDAMLALDNYPGLQTHRSWWVANDAVIKVIKESRKIALALENDLVVPVSKTYLEQVKAAGLGA